MIGNLSPKYLSSILNIHLLCVTRSQTLQEYGAKAVLEPVMKEITYLEEVSNTWVSATCIYFKFICTCRWVYQFW